MGGAGQVEGGIDQMWSTDQRGMHMPWTGVPVSPPVGALSLLEIQEQEFKHAEQKVGGRRGGQGWGMDKVGRKTVAVLNTCINTYAYMYIHTYMHAYICVVLCLSACVSVLVWQKVFTM